MPETPTPHAYGEGRPFDEHPVAGVFNVLMVGVGGQGIVLASDILTDAAVIAGLDAKKSEIHGMSQRGGSVFSHVRFASGPVYSPTIAQGEAHVIYALERMELLRWASWARPDAAAVYLAHDILPWGVSEYPAGVDEEIARIFDRVVRFETKALRQVVSPKVLNTALLGAVSVFTPLQARHYVESMDRHCPAGTAQVNQAGFEAGRELARAQLSQRGAGEQTRP